MSDLKEFLDNYHCNGKETFDERNYISIINLGLFFWERGGKQFVNSWFEKCVNDNIIELINDAESLVKTGLRNHALLAQDFLDCVACLGEDKVKELIKEVKE